jgi:hypothetical protein
MTIIIITVSVTTITISVITITSPPLHGSRINPKLAINSNLFDAIRFDRFDRFDCFTVRFPPDFWPLLLVVRPSAPRASRLLLSARPAAPPPAATLGCVAGACARSALTQHGGGAHAGVDVVEKAVARGRSRDHRRLHAPPACSAIRARGCIGCDRCDDSLNQEPKRDRRKRRQWPCGCARGRRVGRRLCRCRQYGVFIRTSARACIGCAHHRCQDRLRGRFSSSRARRHGR